MSDSTPLSSVALSLGELESTFGALFVGFVVSIILYGFTFFRAYKPVLQTRHELKSLAESYIYFSRYSKDSLWIKLTVSI